MRRSRRRRADWTIRVGRRALLVPPSLLYRVSLLYLLSLLYPLYPLSLLSLL